MARAGALVAGGVVASRLARAARPAPPVVAVGRDGARSHGASGAPVSISVVVPARDEADRITTTLSAVVGAPGVDEVVVVDDRSDDDTAAVARRLGATVVDGAELPPGWAGKAWALQQGIERASGTWVVTLDADTAPSPRLPLAVVRRALDDDLDLLTVAGRFDCPTAPSRWLHAAMLTTLVYRFGPVGVDGSGGGDRAMANGQCMVLHRSRFLADGGMATVAGHPVEDVALVRQRARAGRRVAFLDASELLTVRMYDDVMGTLRGWGRSLALPGVEPWRRQLLDVAVVGLTTTWPLIALARRRFGPVEALLVAMRLGTLGGTARVYDRRGLAYWLSPTADPLALGALVVGSLRRRQRWRGREYVVGRPTTPDRSAPR